jgi:hypothetical protein
VYQRSLEISAFVRLTQWQVCFDNGCVRSQGSNLPINLISAQPGGNHDDYNQGQYGVDGGNLVEEFLNHFFFLFCFSPTFFWEGKQAMST